MLNAGGSGVAVGMGTGGGCGVAFTNAAGGDIAGTGVPVGSGDSTILTAVGPAVGVGVELF